MLFFDRVWENDNRVYNNPEWRSLFENIQETGENAGNVTSRSVGS